MNSHNNLYDPIVYLIQKYVKREFNSYYGGPTGQSGAGKGDYIEGITLQRDDKGRLQTVTGWEYIKYELTYRNDGLLDKVDAIHMITGKHLQIRLIYDNKKLLVEVEPQIMDEGTGDPGRIDLPNVLDDYYDV